MKRTIFAPWFLFSQLAPKGRENKNKHVSCLWNIWIYPVWCYLRHRVYVYKLTLNVNVNVQLNCKMTNWVFLYFIVIGKNSRSVKPWRSRAGGRALLEPNKKSNLLCRPDVEFLCQLTPFHSSGHLKPCWLQTLKVLMLQEGNWKQTALTIQMVPPRNYQPLKYQCMMKVF